KAAPAVLPLVAVLREPNLRQPVIYALQNIGGDADEVLPALRELLDDTDHALREGIAQLVGCYGADGVKFGVELALEDKAPYVRLQAIFSLYNARRDDLEPVLASARLLLKHEDINVRQASVHLIARAGASAAPLLFDALYN